MGNSIGGKKKTTKVMKIDGETFKLRTPIKACDVLADHPGLVLLDSEAVKHYGVRAKPLEAHIELQPKRLYFLVELPRGSGANIVPIRRVRSGINVSAKDRLESLVLSRRSASDLTIMKPKNIAKEEEEGSVRLKMRLPKAEVEKLMQSSKNEAEAADKIMRLCIENNRRSNDESKNFGGEMKWKSGKGRMGEFRKKAHEQQLQRRVCFMPISEEANPVVVASYSNTISQPNLGEIRVASC